VITFENEFVNRGFVTSSPARRLLSSRFTAFEYHQRCYLKQLGLPVPKFVALRGAEGAEGAEGDFHLQPLLTQFGFPVVLKARRHGYDGQGTFVLNDIDALKQIRQL